MDPILKLNAVVAGKATSQHPGQPVIVTLNFPDLRQDIILQLPNEKAAEGFNPTVVEREIPPKTKDGRPFIERKEQPPHRLVVVIFDADDFDKAMAPDAKNDSQQGQQQGQKSLTDRIKQALT